MSSISVLPVTGAGQVEPVKAGPTTNVQPPSSQSQSSAQLVPPAPAATYPSPRVEIDPQVNGVIIQYLNAQNGVLNYQVPSKAQLQLYEQNQAVQTPVAGAKALGGES
jgi:hypothetical protein